MFLETTTQWMQQICYFAAFTMIMACANQEVGEKTLADDRETGKEDGFLDNYVISQEDSIYVRSIGEGVPILFIHGGPGLDHSYFLPHMTSLASFNELIFYDQRASGRSSVQVDSNTISLQGFREDIESIRQHFNFKSWVVLGHSWGGFLALDYSIHFPGVVDRLILINPMPGSTELQEETQLLLKNRETAADSLATARIMQSVAFQNGEVSAYEDLFQTLFATQFYDRAFADSLIISFQPTFLAGSKKLRYLSKDISSYDIHADLAQLKMPTLMIYGAYDPLAGNSASNYARFIPNAQLEIMPHAGHFPFIEQKEAFLLLIHQFLDGTKQDL
jgi:proline iminopeptidase